MQRAEPGSDSSALRSEDAIQFARLFLPTAVGLRLQIGEEEAAVGVVHGDQRQADRSRGMQQRGEGGDRRGGPAGPEGEAGAEDEEGTLGEEVGVGVARVDFGEAAAGGGGERGVDGGKGEGSQGGAGVSRTEAQV